MFESFLKGISIAVIITVVFIVGIFILSEKIMPDTRSEININRYAVFVPLVKDTIHFMGFYQGIISDYPEIIISSKRKDRLSVYDSLSDYRYYGDSFRYVYYQISDSTLIIYTYSFRSKTPKKFDSPVKIEEFYIDDPIKWRKITQEYEKNKLQRLDFHLKK